MALQLPGRSVCEGDSAACSLTGGSRSVLLRPDVSRVPEGDDDARAQDRNPRGMAGGP